MSNLDDLLSFAMQRAIQLAKESGEHGRYPIAAVVMDRAGVILAETGSYLNQGNDPTAHPEVVVIRKACEKTNSRYLEGAYLVSTMEPCPMCTSTAIWAKMAGIAYALHQSDAEHVAKQLNNEAFSFRQITIPCEHVIQRGTPELRVFPALHREKMLNIIASLAS